MSTSRLASLDRPLDAELLQRPVTGHRVPAASTFADLLGAGQDRTTLLVFLRHYG